MKTPEHLLHLPLRPQVRLRSETKQGEGYVRVSSSTETERRIVLEQEVPTTVVPPSSVVGTSGIFRCLRHPRDIVFDNAGWRWSPE